MEEEALDRRSEFGDRFRSVRDVVAVLFKQKTKILTVFFVTLAAVMAWVYFAKPLYEASASLIIKFGREHIYRPEVGPNDPAPYFDSGDAVQSEIKILSSSNLAKRVVDVLGVNYAYPKTVETPSERMTPLEAATLIFRDHLSVNQVEDSNVIDVRFTHPQPKVAAKAVNLLVDFFMEKHLQILSDPKALFFERQLKIYRQQLQGEEKRLQDFKRKHGLSSPTEQQRLLLQQRGKLDASLNHAKSQIEGLRSKFASVEKQIQTVPERIPLSSVTERQGVVAKAKGDLFDLKRKEQELLATYNESSQFVQSLRRQMAMVEQFITQQENGTLADTVTTGTNPVFEKLEEERLHAESELKRVQASSERIPHQIKNLDKKLQQFDFSYKDLQVLQRQVATAQHNHDLYLTKFEEARVSEEMNRLKMSNIRLIQSAEVPLIPAGLTNPMILLLGAISAAVAGIGLAFVFEYMEGSYMRPDEAARDLGLPVLVTINHKG